MVNTYLPLNMVHGMQSEYSPLRAGNSLLLLPEQPSSGPKARIELFPAWRVIGSGPRVMKDW